MQVTIGAKLTLSVGAMLALGLAVGLTSVSALNTLDTRVDSLVQVSGKTLALIGDIKSEVDEMLAWERGLILYSFTLDARAIEAKTGYKKHLAGARAAMERMWPLAVPEIRKMLEDVEARLASWQALSERVAQLCQEEKPDEAWGLVLERTHPVYQEVSRLTDSMYAIQQKVMTDEHAAANWEVTRSRWAALALNGVSAIVVIGIVLNLRRTTCHLRRTAHDVLEAAHQVEGAAEQVSATSQTLAQGASEQAASLQQTSASSEEISSMTRQNAENSAAAVQLMQQAADVVIEVNHAVDAMAQSMTEISQSSARISKIIKVIDEIAFQTNILALNAAVEAARAGEAGMGFAVVADEVRNLAQRCAQAARDTAELIEESITKSAEGGRKLEQVTRAMRQNVEIAGKAKLLVDEVNVGSQEQARGVEQVAKAISHMEYVTQKTAASAEESASAGEELTALSQAMKQAAAHLDALVGSQRG
jgi:methyl-accepting chemotaxis protein/methyl-accepting chemotaxis protein-1 (serine sensor receptor)